MKKLILSLFLTVCFVNHAFAAGSCTYTRKEAPTGHKGIEITATCTADGSANFPTGADSSLIDFASVYRGQYLYFIGTYYSGTPVTDNTDLVLHQHSVTGHDALNGAGANRLDSATINTFQPEIDSTPSAVPIYGPLYIDISGNSVNSAIHEIVFYFIEIK